MLLLEPLLLHDQKGSNSAVEYADDTVIIDLILRDFKEEDLSGVRTIICLSIWLSARVKKSGQ